MARYWDNKEVAGRGTKFCLVIDPEDGTHPIRTYGWSQDEVLDKVAKTAETAQQVINRQRNGSVTPPSNGQPPVAASATVPPSAKPLTADERMQATADLSNPAKAPQAIKTLLRDEGIDLDQQKLQTDARRAGAIAEAWERQHPDFPSDERNQRLIMKLALVRCGSLANLTPEVLDATFAEMREQNMLFEVSEPEQPPVNPPNPANAPNGNSATRDDRPRNATSYRRTALRSPEPVNTTKPKYTRAEVDTWNSKQLREKIESEPGFKEWYNREFSATA